VSLPTRRSFVKEISAAIAGSQVPSKLYSKTPRTADSCIRGTNFLGPAIVQGAGQSSFRAGLLNESVARKVKPQGFSGKRPLMPESPTIAGLIRKFSTHVSGDTTGEFQQSTRSKFFKIGRTNRESGSEKWHVGTLQSDGT
jgi:hypothetical protein